MEILQVVEDGSSFEILDKLGPKFFVRLAIDLVMIFILIRIVYYPIYKKKDFILTFTVFNVVIYLITYLLNKNDGLSVGAAFGLFAVFSLLRYRTEDISARDMTYLFMSIALGLLSSVAKGTYFETVIIDFIVILVAFFLDGNLLMKNESVRSIQYEKIENIKPENRQILIEDLRNRTGLDIHKVNVSKIDFTKDTAVVKIYYYEKNNRHV